MGILGAYRTNHCSANCSIPRLSCEAKAWAPTYAFEQGVEFSLALADRVYVLEKDAVYQGSASSLRDDGALPEKLLTL